MILYLLAVYLGSPVSSAAILSSKLACTQSERWGLPGISAEDQEIFVQSLNDDSNLALSVARAEQLSLRTQDRGMKLFGEYWKARALYQAGLVHTAVGSFNSIVEHEVLPNAIGVQLAALECVLAIQSKLKRLDFTSGGFLGVGRIAEYVLRVSQNPRVRRVVYTALMERVLHLLGREGGAVQAAAALAPLKGDPSFGSLAEGLVAAASENHAGAVASLEAYFKAPQIDVLKRYQDSARISLARSYVSLGKDREAIPHFQKVRKESNEVVQALVELAWLFLRQKKHQEAIGVTYNIFSGYRSAFAPGTLMLMAMALNELCQYPGALKTVAIFKSDYRKAYEWLKAAPTQGLYASAIAQLEKKDARIPGQVFTEWMRSPVFVGLQQEINAIQDEKASLRRSIKRLKTLDRDAIAAYPPLGEVATRLSGWFLNLYRGMPKLEAGVISLIEKEFTRKNRMMLSRMNEISENIHLIEVEIFNGASEDVVWRNLHPDYQGFVDEVKAAGQSAIGQKVWSWGTVVSSEGGAPEVWEDELGTLRANLSDNCSNRDRYAQVRLK